MFAPLAYTKTYAMAAAAALSITLVPVLMGLLIRGHITPEHKNPINRGLIAIYRPVINLVLRKPMQILLGGIIVTVVGVWPITQLGGEFMPTLDEGDLLYMPSAFPAISIGKAGEILQQTDKLIRTVPEVESVFGKVGRADTATDPAPLTMIETTIRLKPRDQWREGLTLEGLKQELNSIVKIPSMANTWDPPIKIRIDMLSTGIKTPIGIKVAGPDLNVIQDIGKQIEQVLNPVQGTQSVYAERVAGGRYVTVDINRLASARLGLNIMDIQDVISTAVGGLNITQSVEGLERYPVNIRYPQSSRNSLEKIRNLPLVTPMGAHIPLSQIATINIENGPAMIKSENARLNGWIYVSIEDRDIASYVDEAKQIVANQVELPAGYSIAWSGQYEYFERALKKLSIVGPLTLAIIMLLLYLNFRNFVEVFIIMGTLPVALAGGAWLLYILGYNLSVAVGVGFIALSGVAVEIGVLMLVYLNIAYNARHKNAIDEGRSLTLAEVRESVVEGALLRVRPIMMTVSAIIVGLLPILFGTGTGSEVMSRIAAPMVGGMVTATLLTLVVIPAVFIVWKSRGLKEATF